MRKLSAMMFMVLMALLLVACGGGEDEEDAPAVVNDAPTVEEAVESTATEPALDDEATPDETLSLGTAVADGSPTSAVVPSNVETGATPAPGASPVVGASPVAGATPAPFASPVTNASPVSVASPVTSASPVSVASPVSIASPVTSASPVVVAPVGDATPGVMASPVSATPDAGIVVVLPGSEGTATPIADTGAFTLNGRVELAGNVNEAYVLTEDGCVGLGDNADMRDGRQVVVRSETGTIVGVTTLEPADVDDECVWTFTVDVPESEFYAVSIPMKTELVFAHDDIEENDGEIRIVLP